MNTIKPTEQDYKKLVTLFKEFFPTHNIFSQSDDRVIAYLKDHASQHEFVVDSELRSAMFLVMKGESADKSHKIWKFRHFAFEDEDIAKDMLEEAERIISEKSETAKIELTIAETEEGKEFYLENGYSQEGELENHYRFGESCYILGKSIN